MGLATATTLKPDGDPIYPDPYVAADPEPATNSAPAPDPAHAPNPAPAPDLSVPDTSDDGTSFTDDDMMSSDDDPSYSPSVASDDMGTVSEG